MLRTSKRSRTAADCGCQDDMATQHYDTCNGASADPQVRLKEFSQYFKGVVVECSELKAELLNKDREINIQLEKIEQQETQLLEKESIIKKAAEIEVQCQNQIDVRNTVILSLNARIGKLNADMKALSDQHREESNTNQNRIRVLEARVQDIDAMQNRLDDCHASLNMAQSMFMDPITLDQDATCIPLTSGQVINLKGLVELWIFDNRFTGDMWYPFPCPITKMMTYPVRDLGESFRLSPHAWR